MGLDINTPKGQVSLAHEHEVHEQIKKIWKLDIVETPKKTSAKCDGFLIRNNMTTALFEIKCRYDMDYAKLLERQTWLVTYEKIAACQKLSKALQIPFIGFLYLRPKDSDQKLILYWKITNELGDYLFDFEKEKETTQKTINGGEIIRLNAYLPVDKAMLLK